MGNIVLLDDLTINKIAAGEVIERPASVVKELMENSIDAGADNISVEIKNGGISYIRITDNGKGFEADDLEIAFERHATSKIRQADDLETVKTMGFRGEALASIAAISRVELVTKTEDSDIGHRIVVEGGKVILKEETGCPKGSSITIENLFYNTPVRYKFLKKDFTESGYVEDSIARIALVNPNIAIKFVNSGKTVIQTSGNGEIKDIVYGIYGKDIAENIINVEYHFEDMVVKGVIGKPGIARSNRSNQLFFVNKRYVKDKTLTSAAEQGFKGLLGIGKYGFLVLNIEMDPHKLDVNVHPAKLEVRFQEENKVFKLVYHAIKEALVKGNVISSDSEMFKEDIVKNNYLSEIEKINNENENKIDKDIGEIKGIGSFFKNILNNSKNEFSTNEENVVEQVYKDKLQKEQETLLHNMQNTNTELVNNSNYDSIQQNVQTSTQKHQEDYNSIQKNEQHDNIMTKEEVIEPEGSEKNDNLISEKLGFNSEEYKGNKNLERLVKELEANLEKLNLKSQAEQINNLNDLNPNDISEENVDKVKETNESDKDKFNEINEVDSDPLTNNSENIIEDRSNKEKVEDNNSINIDNEQTKKSENSNNAVVAEETKKQIFAQTLENILDKKITEEKEQFENKKETLQNSQNSDSNEVDAKDNEKSNTQNISEKTDENNKDDDPPINFEEMYEKMFGTNISNRNKVEEKEENGYSVKQEDLKTVEKFSLFTNSSVYSKPAYKFVGIVFENSIIIEYEREMYIINQKAANERIIYEKVKKNYYSNSDKDSQLMLLPDVINLTPREMGIAKDIIQILRNAGFDLEEFGENTIKLNGVPGICIDLDTRQLFIEILNAVNTVARTARQEIEEKLIETIAEKAAENAKMALTAQEVDNLMMKLLVLPQPFVSPQGTPTAIRMSKADIERKFSRR